MPAVPTSVEGVTRVSVADLVALRGRALRPALRASPALTVHAGGHVSPLRGRGMDYAESRPYQHGDDVRAIDWRRTARSGKWHTKLFQEEREQSLLLLLDTSRTLYFGTRVRFKSVAAARVAACWTWTGVRAGDRVGAVAFGALHAAVPPRTGTRGALAMLGALADWDRQVHALPDSGKAGEPLSAALLRVQHLLVPGWRCLLLSDGWCSDAPARAALGRIARRVDLRVLIVADALEREPAVPGTYTFETDGERHTLDLTGRAARARFRAQLGAGHVRLSRLCAEAGVACGVLPAEGDPEAPLRDLWRHPRRRR